MLYNIVFSLLFLCIAKCYSNVVLTPSLHYDHQDDYPAPVQSKVTLNCSVSIPTNATVRFMKDSHPIKTSEKFVLTQHSDVAQLDIVGPKASDVGEYTCVVSKDGVDIGNSSVSLYGKPFPLRNITNIDVMEKDGSQLVCHFISYPSPFITWSALGKDDREDISLPMNSVISKTKMENDTLSFSNIKKEDRAYYVCTAENDHGSYSIEIYLRVKDKYAALWPFLGILLEVVVLCAVIFGCERKRAKKARQEEAAMRSGGDALLGDAKSRGAGEARRRC